MKFIITLLFVLFLVTASVSFFDIDSEIRYIMGTSGLPIPEPINEIIIKGGFTGTLAGLGYLAVLSGLLTYAFTLTTRLIMRTRWKFLENSRPDTPAPNQNGISNKTDDVTLTVSFIIPETGIPSQVVDIFPSSKSIIKESKRILKENKIKKKLNEREETSYYTYSNLEPVTYLRLGRASLKLKNNDQPSSLNKLYLAGVSILAAHKDWPADTGQHHAGVGLYDHAIKVAQNLSNLTNHPCAPVIGLFHDMGKILAYKKSGSAFKKATKMHDPLSVFIIKQLPEFNNLTPKAASLIEDVLLYAHSPYKPVRLKENDDFKLLCDNLKYADGSAVKTEAESSANKYVSGDRFNNLVAVVWAGVNDLNINDYKNQGKPDGFSNSKHDVIMVPVTNLISAMARHASPQLSKELMLEVGYMKLKSRDLTPILKALEHLKLLNKEYIGLESESALFNVKSGSISFNSCVLLDKGEIFKQNPKVEHQWGESKYPLSVLRAS